MNTILELKDVSKEFPGVKALQNVSFTINEGEVVALIGANGAGKSTMLKTISGVFEKDSGEMYLYGEKVHFSRPAQAKAAGIATIYQELTIIPNLTIAENIFLSDFKNHAITDYKTLNKKAKEIMKNLALDLNPKMKASELSVANQQMVEIARAISEKARIFIMDEPTSALTSNEKDNLFKVVRSLKEQGLGIVFVSHRLNEVYEIAERVTILKNGRLVGHYNIKDLSEKKMVELMIGGVLDSFYPKKTVPVGDVVLKVENIKSGHRVKDVSFNVRKGEIVGLTGLLGAGRTETARCIFGLDKYTGNVYYYGNIRKFRNPKQAANNRVALVPEDRKMYGLVLKMNITENICLGSKEIQFFRKKRTESQIACDNIKKLNIKCTSGKQKTLDLSGGNQQKVVISKWLLRNADIVILDEPTRGIDVEAKAEVHKLIGDIVEMGAAVILISSEFDEIMGLCDRAVVLFEGVVVGEVDRKDFSEERLMAMSHGQMAN
ncbi:MAG: sugar ABC transporter ATP-binding protein [Christensenellales bacterium]